MISMTMGILPKRNSCSRVYFSTTDLMNKRIELQTTFLSLSFSLYICKMCGAVYIKTN